MTTKSTELSRTKLDTTSGVLPFITWTFATLCNRHDQIVFAPNYFPNDLNRRFTLQQLCLNLNSLFANRRGERLKSLSLFLRNRS